MAEFKNLVLKLSNRLSNIYNLFGSERIEVICDNLKKNNEKKVERELLYLKNNDQEIKLFVFGTSFFISELSEQEFKKKLTLNSLNLQIFRAYNSLKKKNKKIKISDILNKIQNKEKDSMKLDHIIERILSLSYYFEWDLIKDKNDIEGDRFIKMPDKYLLRLRQRYNFDNLSSIYENDSLFVFLNGRGSLNLVFKNKDAFNKEDIIKKLFPALRRIFKLKTIEFKK